MLERLRQSRTPEEAQEGDYRKDYRIVLCVIPREHLTSWLRESGFSQAGNTRQMREENATKTVVENWLTICSRIGTQHSFVVSHEYYRLYLDDDRKKLFADQPVPLKPPKDLNKLEKPFEEMGLSQLHPYQGSPALPHELEAPRQQGRYTAQELEEIYKEGYKKLKDYYSYNHPAVSPLSDLFRLEPADIIKNPLTAAVFGDINIDSVCSLDDDFNIPKGANHIQRREHMEKDIGGKGYLMARELDALGTSFDCIRLVGKLGIDSEMQLILQDLKQHQRIEPILFFSSQYRTGSTFSLRRKNDKRAILTITDEPSANSRLTLKEIEGRLQEIVELSDYIFVSGYCLLDGRLEIVERIVDLLPDCTAEEPRKLILEFSPRTLYEKRFAHSPDKLRNLLEKTFLLVFEAGAFPQNAETDLVKKPLFCLKLDFGSEKQFERSRTGDWTEQPFRLGNNTWKKGTVGLTNQLMTQHIDTKFWKPRILLCSRSPRRFSLLANVYDKFAIHHYL